MRAGEEEIGSDLDDDDSEGDDEDATGGAAADGSGPGDIVYCTYDKVRFLDRHHLELLLTSEFLGSTSQSKVEMRAQRWHRVRWWKRLPFLQVYRVRAYDWTFLCLETYRIARNREFEW